MAGSTQPQIFFAQDVLLLILYRCHFSFFISENFVHIIWVLPHSDIKFEDKNQF